MDAIQVGPPADLDTIVTTACIRAGIRPSRYRQLRHFANAVYLVEDDIAVVARVVAYGEGAVERSLKAVAVAQWLAEQGLPVTEVAIVDQPVIIDDDREIAITFWRYYPQPSEGTSPGVGELGTVARALHSLPAAAPVNLPAYDPLRSVSRALSESESTEAGRIDGLPWLRRRIDDLVKEYRCLHFPLGVGLIHGDLYTGNLLWTGNGSAVLGDWDSVCVGPREVDLAPTFTALRFGLDRDAVDLFAAIYGHDLRTWPGFPILRSIREVSTLTALIRLAPGDPAARGELSHRLDTLRRGDTAALWRRQ